MDAYKYNEKADEALNKLYLAGNATSTDQRIEVIETALQERANFYAFGGELTPEMKLGCLEYEYLGRKGLIELTLA